MFYTCFEFFFLKSMFQTYSKTIFVCLHCMECLCSACITNLHITCNSSTLTEKILNEWVPSRNRCAKERGTDKRVQEPNSHRAASLIYRLGIIEKLELFFKRCNLLLKPPACFLPVLLWWTPANARNCQLREGAWKRCLGSKEVAAARTTHKPYNNDRDHYINRQTNRCKQQSQVISQSWSRNRSRWCGCEPDWPIRCGFLFCFLGGQQGWQCLRWLRRV